LTTSRGVSGDAFVVKHTKVIAATANEAPYVLDALLYHQSSLALSLTSKAQEALVKY
jgi:Tn3 transposase DDE domain